MVKDMVHIEIALYVSFIYYGSKVWNNSDFFFIIIVERNLLSSSRLHLFDQKYS